MSNENVSVLTESEYRNLVHELFQRIEKAFFSVDPDIAECENSQGALVIRFEDESKLILSQQASVRQVWMAVASKGIAFHFDYSPSSQKWLDDKGNNIELLSYLKNFVQTKADIELPEF